MAALMRIALIVLLFAACAKDAAPPPVVAPPMPITTDRTTYRLQPGPHGPQTTIITTFTAPADKTVYVTNCNGAQSLGLQRDEGGVWRDAWVGEINGCASAPIVIKPGAKHTATMKPVDRDHLRVEPGTYRAVWYGVLTSYDPGKPQAWEELPLEQRVSAPITIE